jgi:hypothetical protein
MTHEKSTAIEPYMAIQPRRFFALLPQRREDYPVINTPDGDRIIVPLKDYRKFRGDASYWQFLFLVMTAGLIGILFMVLSQPPVYVEKPFIVEKEKPVIVPSKCLVFCK